MKAVVLSGKKYIFKVLYKADFALYKSLPFLFRQSFGIFNTFSLKVNFLQENVFV